MNEMNIDIKQAPTFFVINAIRILCNTFKHNNGRYENNPAKPYDILDQNLIDRWKILEDRYDFDYSKLPIKELVLSSHQFIEYLMKEVFDKIENHLNISN